MVDTQLISVLLGAREVALYQAIFRIVLILMVFSDILSNVLLPYLSFKIFKKEDIGPLINKLFFYLLIVGSSLFLLFTSFKASLIQFLYTTEYLEAIALILPFGIVVIIRTLSTLLGNILTISHRQVYRVAAVSISLIVSLCLNLLLIPRFGIIASAWISVLVHLILFGMYLFYSKAEVRNFRIIGTSNIIVLATTTFIYFWLNVWGTVGFWSILVSVIAWCLVVFLLMRSNGNWTFLRAILSEKGVG
jgi:O-antigen/teichoic acid export membrane protein